MSRKKNGSIFIAIILIVAMFMSMTVVAAGEGIASEPSSSGSSAPTPSGSAGVEDSVFDTEPSGPNTSEPGTSEPGTSEPGTSEPGTSEPGTSEPGTSEPGTSEPGGTPPPVPDDPTMHVSDKLLDVLKQLEGFEPYAYWDYKQYSIGYGSKCPDGMVEYYQKNPITREYAEELLQNELVEFEKSVNKFIERNGLTLTQNQYDALISFTYNTGYAWTSTTGNLVTAVISGDKGSHLLYGMMLWSMAGKRHILINRRIIELNIYANGVYPEDVYAKDAIPTRYRIAFMDGNGGTVKYEEHGFDAEQPISIKTEFKTYPTYVDENGQTKTCVLDGWYTERIGGTKVEIMDASVPTGTVLYAHWKTTTGKPVVIPRQESSLKVKVTVTDDDVNVRSGPETYYASLYKAKTGDVLEIEEVMKRGSLLWGRFGDRWISLKYTDYNDVIAQQLPKWGKVTSSTLNVRKGAGTDYGIVEGVQKKKDDLLRITEWKSDESMMWYGMMWGKIEEGWVALPYLTFDGVLPPNETVKTVTISKMPDKLSYLHKTDALDITGGKLLVTYADNSSYTIDMTSEMVSGFDNTKVGENTITVTYGGKTATFKVQIVKAKVIFKLENGTIISEKEYLIGDTVEIPADPTLPPESGSYVFAGWDREVVTTCDGNAVYIAKFKLQEKTGDVNGDGFINDRDVLYLLDHTLFSSTYPIKGTGDMNGDGFVNDRDVLYLLDHTLFPNTYPLPN